MIAMFKEALKYIDAHPRIILMMGWPIFTLFTGALIWIVWKGPWHEVSEHQQLSILGGYGFCFLGILGLGYLAQSMTFFGKLGFRVGSFLDVNATDNTTYPDLRATALPTQDHH